MSGDKALPRFRAPNPAGRARWFAHRRAPVVVCAVLCAATWGLGDITPVNEGLGWDGARYASMMPNLWERVWSHELPAIYVARLLPYALLEMFCSMLDIDRSSAVTVAGFRSMNWLLLVSCAWAWTEIARIWRLSAAAAWLGTFGLVVNLAALKWGFYLPVLTDQWGLACGVFAALGVVKRSRIILLATGAVASFTWPTFAPIAGILCFAFPRDSTEESRVTTLAGHSPARGGPHWWGRAAALMTALLVCAALWYLAAAAFAGKFGDRFGANAPWPEAFPVSVAIATLWIGAGAWGWWGEVAVAARRAREYVCLIDWRGTFCLGVLAIGLPAVCWALSNGWSGLPMSARYAFKNGYLFRGIARPGVFLVAHAAYFGPLFVCAAATWPSVLRACRSTSLSMLVAAGLALAVSLNSESRHMIAYWGLLLPWVIRSLDQNSLSLTATWLLCAAQGLWSKAWWVSSSRADVDGTLEVGLQRRDSGPWMTDASLTLHAVALVVASACVIAWIRARRTAPRRTGAA